MGKVSLALLTLALALPAAANADAPRKFSLGIINAQSESINVLAKFEYGVNVCSATSLDGDTVAAGDSHGFGCTISEKYADGYAIVEVRSNDGAHILCDVYWSPEASVFVRNIAGKCTVTNPRYHLFYVTVK